MPQRQLLPATWKNLYYPPEQNEYTYFLDKAQYPYPAADNLRGRYGKTSHDLLPFVKAAYAADAALLSYGRWGQRLMPDPDFQQILTGFEIHPFATGEATGTQGYFAQQEDFAILAFRGTEKDDPKDALTDVSALLVDEADYSTAADEPQKALRYLSIIESLFHPRQCKVHEGFQLALNDVWEEVHKWISSYRAGHPHSEICFTGHSLGAALATLAVSRFGGGNASLYTFGCPRVGNEAFCERAVHRADLGVVRFVNGNDPVTHVPLEELGYRHTAPPMRHIDYNGDIQELAAAPIGDWSDLAGAVRGLPRAGLFTVLDSPAPVYLADHSPAQYSIRLWNYAEANLA